MPDFRPVSLVIGFMLITLGLGMLVPAIADAVSDEADAQVFLISSGVTVFAGIALFLASRSATPELSLRQAFILTTMSWIVIAAFGALPFMFSELNLSYTDAFFEAMSGVTTTGATVITGLDSAPPGILLWRAILQWLGGIGIVVTAVAVLPMLQIGGMQLFRIESSDTSEKILPRAAQLATAITLTYVGLTAVCALTMWMAGMQAFDAVAHSMTTIATGGFSTSDNSVGSFDSAGIESVFIVFMLLGSLPFVLYLQALRGGLMNLLRDDQVRLFLMIAASAVAVMTLWLWFEEQAGFGSALRKAAFSVVSILTGSGFVSANYAAWGGFAVAAFFFLSFIGGCAGSTACGIKVFRFQILWSTTRVQIRRLLQPHGVFIAKYNAKPVSDDVTSAVTNFFFLFLVCFVVLALALTALGLDFVTAWSGAIAALANVGPGLGDVIGPDGNYLSLPGSAKWLLAGGMLLGRLELLTVLVLFTVRFWRS